MTEVTRILNAIDEGDAQAAGALPPASSRLTGPANAQRARSAHRQRMAL